MFIFLPDSPVTAKGLSKRERRMAVERLRENQTGVENKNLKPYQILEAFMDYKLYIFFTLGVVCMCISYNHEFPSLNSHLHRQCPQWWNLEFRHYHYQRIRILDIGDHSYAGETL